MMKWYIGYFNRPGEFTVICACPHEYAASFILESYQNHENSMADIYKMRSAADLMDVEVVF